MKNHDWDRFLAVLPYIGDQDSAGDFAEVYGERFSESCFQNRTDAEILSFLKTGAYWKGRDALRKAIRMGRETAAFAAIPPDNDRQCRKRHPLEDNGSQEPLDLLIQAEEAEMLGKIEISIEKIDRDPNLSKSGKWHRKKKVVDQVRGYVLGLVG